MSKTDTFDPGYHNRNWQAGQTRLMNGKTYRNLSTICVIPTRGMIHARVLQSWFNLMSPMNQQFVRIFAIGMEVADAYNTFIRNILDDPNLSKFKYLLTLEEDNLPPPDGLLKLYESMDKFDAVGGLYWTKGEGGQPMIYGNPLEAPKNFIPQLPLPETVQPCNGLGMGFTLFKLKMFADPELPQPWFKTLQEYRPGQGSAMFTQDLYFFQNAGRAGYRFACDTRVKVGHFDPTFDQVW